MATTTEITITIPEGRAPLWGKYPGQTNAQPAFLEFDPDLRSARFGINPSAGPPHGVPMDVHNRLRLRWRVPANLSQNGCKDLAHAVLPLLESVAAGHATEWDGSNTVGRLSADAVTASEAIETLCDDYEGAFGRAEIWDAGEWLISDSDRTAADVLGLKADSTDTDLDRIAAECEQIAAGDGIVLDGDVKRELEALRSRIAE